MDSGFFTQCKIVLTRSTRMEKRDRIIIQGNIYITGIDEKKYKKSSFI